jgi:hypothetical protein
MATFDCVHAHVNLGRRLSRLGHNPRRRPRRIFRSGGRSARAFGFAGGQSGLVGIFGSLGGALFRCAVVCHCEPREACRSSGVGEGGACGEFEPAAFVGDQSGSGEGVAALRSPVAGAGTRPTGLSSDEPVSYRFRLSTRRHVDGGLHGGNDRGAVPGSSEAATPPLEASPFRLGFLAAPRHPATGPMVPASGSHDHLTCNPRFEQATASDRSAAAVRLQLRVVRRLG